MQEKHKIGHQDRTNIQRYRDMATLLHSGWWEFDLKNRYLTCSENICQLIGFDKSTVTSKEFLGIVREDYRKDINNNFNEYSAQGISFKEKTYPIITPRGEVWIKSSVGAHEINDDENYMFGTFQIVPSPEQDVDVSAAKLTRHLLLEINKISSSLSDFLTCKDEDMVINNLLKGILDFYHLSDVFLFEFTEDHKYQSCTHEVCADNVQPVLDRYRYLDNAKVPWFSKKILSKESVVIDMITQMPAEAEEDYSFFVSLGVNSYIGIPLLDGDNVWGFIGVDVRGKIRHWTDEDYLLLLSFSRIVGICISLARVRENTETVMQQKDTLLKHMPVGYERLQLIRDEGNRVIDYRVEESNLLASKLLGAPEQITGALGSKLHDKEFVKTKLDFIEKVIENRYAEADIQPNPNLYCHKIAYLLNKEEVGELLIDTTETVNAYKSKYRSEKMFTDIFKNIPIGEAIYDLNGRMTDMNYNFMEIFGLTSIDDVKGYFLTEDKNLSDEIKGKLLREENFVYNLDYNFDLVDNYRTLRRGIINIHCKVLRLFDENAKCFGLLLICVEDSDRLVAINRIHDFDNFILTISSYAKVGYMKYNLMSGEGYAIKQWYDNIEEDENKPLDTIIGKYERVHPEDRSKVLDFLEKIKRGEETAFNSEIRVKCRGAVDKWKWLYSNLLVIKYAPNDGIIEIISSNYDITRFKEVEIELTKAREKAETMDKLKSAFMANMSHEIRTPLNAIVGFSDLLVNTQDMEEREQYISILHENNDLLLQLINDILDLSKLEAGMVDLNYTDLNVNLLCNDIVQSMSFKVKQNVELIFDSYLPVCTINTDRYRLTQVISNFITNAIKFTDKGSIRIGYEWPDNKHIRFYVADTGIGISADKQESVFNRFVKLNDFAQGTGLGLSICRNIVEQMGGEIGVDSEKGKGSCFWFILPADKAKSTSSSNRSVNSSEIESIVADIKKEEQFEEKPVILVAEDIESNYILVKNILKNYRVERACNGVEAVNLTSKLRPNLVLMDMKMPEMDGLEATRRIREFDKSTPIIAVTAYAFAQDVQNAFDAGCNDYMSKPISSVNLREKVISLLKKN